MRQCMRCSAAPATGQEVQGQVLEFRRMACALLLRGRQETVTSAWTWITGYVFPNRYKDITPPVCFIGVDQSTGKYFYPVLILHVD